MNQRDGFASGFLAGTIVGGIVGGVLGALLASQRANESTADVEPRRNDSLSEPNNTKGKRRQLKATDSSASIEAARRSLEDKIAQLNETIDEVRLTLGDVNRNQPEGNTERSFTREP
jgi:gas vesicle protein